jgi:hypothetical protein
LVDIQQKKSCNIDISFKYYKSTPESPFTARTRLRHFTLRRSGNSAPCAYMCSEFWMPRTRDRGLSISNTLPQLPTFSSVTMSYQYQTLPSTHHIRALQLEPASAKPHPIRARLQLIDLDDEPHYNCLSYTWSGPRYQDVGEEWEFPNRIMIIDGVEVPIRRNLLEALIHIRTLSIAALIWVDAVCINQQDMQERNSQVAMMGKIYKNAEEVVIWLGPSDKYTKVTLEAIRRFNYTREESSNDIADITEKRAIDPGVSLLLDHRYAAAQWTDEEKDNILTLYTSCAWFSRMWTLQEILLAKKSTFLIGHFTVDLEMLWGGSLIYAYGAGSSIWNRLKGTKALRLVREFGSVMIEEYTGRVHGKKYRDIGHQANANRTRVATDPKDKVFGVYGVSSKLYLHLRLKWQAVRLWVSLTQAATSKIFLHRPFVVDYSRSVQTIYAEAQLHALYSLQGFPALSNVGDRSKNITPNQPTWVPDFAQEITHEPLVGESRIFSAATKYKTYFGSTPNPLAMVFPATLVDTIEETCEAHWEIGEEEKINNMFSLILHPDTRGAAEEVLEHVIMWALVAGEKFPLYGPPGTNYEHGFERWLYSHLSTMSTSSVIENYSKLQLGNSILPARVPELERAIASGAQQLNSPEKLLRLLHRRVLHSYDHKDYFFAAWKSACRNRVMFRTKKGYIGLGLPRVQQGDRVYLRAGAQMPYIFRHQPGDPDGQNDTVLHLEGEAYIHGIMHGEAAEDLEFHEITVF